MRMQLWLNKKSENVFVFLGENFTAEWVEKNTGAPIISPGRRRKE